MKNVKLFSHSDLDGIGCNILIRNIGCNNDIENLNYSDINDRIKKFIILEEYIGYDYIFITDISVNEEVAELLEELHKYKDIKIVLLDHHITALWLNKYEWATVEENIVNDNGAIEKTSGTELLYKYLCDEKELTGFNYFFDDNKTIADLVMQIKRYDTWLWNTKYKDNKPKQLNDLFYILGKDRFIDMIEEYDYNVNNFINDNSLLLTLEQEKIDKYIFKKNSEIILRNINGYKVGIVFADRNQSELGNKLSEANKELDLIAMIGTDTISYRTSRDYINCSEFAKLFNGGGHPKASGSQIDMDLQGKIINLVFDVDNYDKERMN